MHHATLLIFILLLSVFSVITQANALAQSKAAYCITDQQTDPRTGVCADTIHFEVAKGEGGVRGKCDTVVGWSQKIMENLEGSQQEKLTNTITNLCSTARSTTPYISTYTVIDSYNLAGFSELKRTSHADGATLLRWWQANPPGYQFIAYEGSIRPLIPMLTPGQVIFLGEHVAILNAIEVDGNGNGWISILHSDTGYWLSTLVIDNWIVVNIPDTYPLKGFGTHL